MAGKGVNYPCVNIILARSQGVAEEIYLAFHCKINESQLCLSKTIAQEMKNQCQLQFTLITGAAISELV